MASNRAKIPLTIVRGSTLNTAFTWSTGDCKTALTPVDLTGASARLQVRESPESAVLFELSTADGTIVLNEQPGKVRYLMTPVQTMAVQPLAAAAAYDLEITFADGSVVNNVFGPVTVESRLTHG